MSLDPGFRNRRSIRPKGYDYSRAGAYYVTVCSHGRECIFGEVVDGAMRLNPIGQIVDAEWRVSAGLREEIELDAWVVMPNHVHGIVIIDGSRRGDRPVAPTSNPGAPATDRDACTPVTDRIAGIRTTDRIVGVHRGDRPVAPTSNPVSPATDQDAVARTTDGGARGPRPRSLGAFVAGFKSAATSRINRSRQSPGVPVWQRNYFEHIIRDDAVLNRIRRYVDENPLRWAFDRENPLGVGA